GPHTIKTIYEAVVQNNIPAILFEGTGRCCDCFAKVYHKYLIYKDQLTPPKDAKPKENSTPISEEEVKEILRAEVADFLIKFKGHNTDSTDYFQMIYECVHKKFKFLTIIGLNVNYDSEPDIDLVILNALLTASDYFESDEDKTYNYSQHKLEQLQLALDWDRVDIAKSYIMTNEQDWAKLHLNNLFLTSLDRNQIKFTELFLEHDFSLTNLFQNCDTLVSLYSALDTLPHSARYYRLLDVSLDDDDDDGDIGPNDKLHYIYKRYVKPLIGDFFEIDAVLGVEIMNDESNCCTGCIAKIKEKRKKRHHGANSLYQ
ncbi:unnamed protein product, partial [Didymodactylos carnosus]